MNGQIKMSAVTNYLQETAWRHAEHLGFGYEDALKRNEFWVIIGLMIRLVGQPQWGQKIIIETWPKGIDRLFAFRDFRILSEDGNILGAATSTWMILDRTTRRPKSVDIVKPVLYLATQQDILEANPPLLPTLTETGETVSRKVMFSEVDQNGHVNNTRYIDWSIDALSSDWHRSHRISELIINYIAEVRPDETILIARGPAGEHSQSVQGLREDGKVIFRTRIDFTPMP
jgi:acyl-ACP thioesterase